MWTICWTNKTKARIMTVIELMKQRYETAKTAAVWSHIHCPACGTTFMKRRYNKVFCSNARTTGAGNCKDAYWNMVDPNRAKYWATLIKQDDEKQVH